MEIFSASCVVPVTGPPIAGGALVVDEGRIVDLGPVAAMRAAYGAPCIDYPGSVITPGLVNAHCHLELTHFPSWKLRKGIDYSPRTYVDWIIQVIKIKRALTLPELEQSVREGVRMSLESGTTCIGDVVSDRRLLPLYGDVSLGGRLYLEMLGHDPERCSQLLSEVRAALAAFPVGNFLAGLSPHAPHTLSDRLFGEVAALAGSEGLPTMVHLAESREESAFLHDSGGKIAELLYPFAGWEAYLPPPRRTSSAAHLDGVGALGPGTCAVHCVHVTPADVAILKKRGVTAILCPRSNDRLVVGSAPVHLLEKAGVPLALGTDSLASNDSLSLWDEMRFFLDIFSGDLTPAELFRMVTIDAARALRLQDRVGSLERGKRADFLVVRPHRLPQDAAELFSVMIEQSQVQQVFVGGCEVIG